MISTLLESLDDTKASKGLISLPVNVLVALFEHIDKQQDALSLAVTCKFLQAIGQDRVEALVNPFEGSWAGDRIICVGDYADSLPPGVVVDADQDNNLYHTAKQQFKELPVDPNGLPEYMDDPDFLDSMSEDDFTRFINVAQAADRSSRATNHNIEIETVLCNLTRHEFIKESTVAKVLGADLGHMLVRKISWSDEWDCGLGGGSWAGDKCEVTTLDQIKDGGQGWKDIGQEL